MNNMTITISANGMADTYQELVSLRLERGEWKAIGEWLQQAMSKSPGEDIDAWRRRTSVIAYPYSQVLEVAADNERFDRGRFYRAAGLEA